MCIPVGKNIHLEVTCTETERYYALKLVISSPGSLLCQLQPCPLRWTPGCVWLLPLGLQGSSLLPEQHGCCCGVTVLHQPHCNFRGHESIAQTLYLSLLLAILVKAFLRRKGTGILCPARCYTLTLRALRIKCIVLLLKDLNVFFPVYTVCF